MREEAVHRIRLRGPWQVQPHRREVPAGTMTVPGSLRDGGWEGYAGRISFRRSFGRPANLEANEHVWLVFERITGNAAARLNGTTLGTIEGNARFDVTSKLADRNELIVDMDASDDCCGIVGDVALEIAAHSD